MEDRLQKILSAYGVASRREAEEMLRAGRVRVNGDIALLGRKANPETDRIQVDGKPLPPKGERVYIMLNKPLGVVTTMQDERGRKTVAELMRDVGAELHPVGRLDLNSEGLLLMTNDGALTNVLTHPAFGIQKRYRVWVRGGALQNAPDVISGIRRIDGRPVRPARVRLIRQDGDSGILEVCIREGRNRQVRKLCAAAGLTVQRLVRVAEGELRLGSLGKGAWRYLEDWEIAYLKHLCLQNPKKSIK